MLNYDFIIKYQSNFQLENWILNIRYWLFSKKNQIFQYPIHNNEYLNERNTITYH